MSAGTWINEGRECSHCGSAHVIKRGVGSRIYDHIVNGKPTFVTKFTQRYNCVNCNKSWSDEPEGVSKNGAWVTKELEAHIVKIGAERGGKASLSRDLKIPILRVTRIYNQAVGNDNGQI